MKSRTKRKTIHPKSKFDRKLSTRYRVRDSLFNSHLIYIIFIFSPYICDFSAKNAGNYVKITIGYIAASI